MQLPEKLNIALKEWASVCSALEEGRQIILLRKGGILEAIGGFELEHPQFFLFPTYLHQNAQMLKESERKRLVSLKEEPSEILLDSAATVTDIVRLRDRAQMNRLDDEHIWTPPLIDMRFNYRPQNPLYLLLLRVYRLAKPITIQNTPEYAGCKSWVPLESSILTTGARPVLDDSDYELRRARITREIA
ncbi:MAG TPA: DUF1802 family protein [Tepidisphaeraceae bacterium]|jgi:hypothetical protein|nr:DUF1802 family protein [Tepidisphaeraceae bacterium]